MLNKLTAPGLLETINCISAAGAGNGIVLILPELFRTVNILGEWPCPYFQFNRWSKL